MKNKLLIILFFLLNDFIYAQCAMCRAVLESSENEGMAEGINNGIVYLAFLPYPVSYTHLTLPTNREV